MEPVWNAESGIRTCTQRPGGRSPANFPMGKGSLKAPGISATCRPSLVLESTREGRSFPEIACGAKHQKYRLCPENSGKRLRKLTTRTSASHPPPGCDSHCNRMAFGGVKKIFVSTGRRQFFCSRKLVPLAEPSL